MDTLKVYRYDDNSIYYGWLILDDTDKSPSGNWNIPANCTIEKPIPEKTGYMRKFVDNQWTYEPQPKEPQPKELSLTELKTNKKIEIQNYVAEKITGGFVSECAGEGLPITYDSDRGTQTTMQGIALNCKTPAFSQKYPNGCPIRGYKPNATVKSIFYLSADGVLQFCADMSEHIGKCKQEGWALQDKVLLAQTKEELYAIEIGK